jgi:hypothetical protein
MPETVEAKMLLGWMTENEALHFLRNCVFDTNKSDDDHRNLWNTYREKVRAIGKRSLPNPATFRLSLAEECSGKTHLNKLRKQNATNIKRVIKIDPRQLVIHQLYVVMDQSRGYEAAAADRKGRLHLSLGIGLENKTPILAARRNGDWLIKDIPHCEFKPFAMIGTDDFIVQEMARFISLTEFDDRILLWAGYHRSHALVSKTYPEDTERLLVGTLVSDGDGFLGPTSELADKRDIVRGECPPLFGDFFDKSLCIEVKYLKLRPELHWNPKTNEYRVPMVPL